MQYKSYIITNRVFPCLINILDVDVKSDAQLLDIINVHAVSTDTVPFGYSTLAEAQRDFNIERVYR